MTDYRSRTARPLAAPPSKPSPGPLVGCAAGGVAGVLITALLAWLLVNGLPSWPEDILIVVLYEADNGEPPAYAAGAANELRKAGRDVRLMDDDPATGLNTVPREVAPAIEPGRKIMGGTNGKGFALLLLSGSRVVKAGPLPGSKEAILEACK